ncbi:MAG: M3 family metallopeptidase [Propionibacteriaceae bacterium]|jgi:peptidyl-dipeptidase Dcp|nr:M3 family metallopeptidase [Propionibacteriaceae bacterium]
MNYRELFAIDAPGLAVPAFGSLKDDDYLAAIRQGMEEKKTALDALAAETAAPTAEILEVWERSGRLLERAEMCFYTLKDSDSNERLDEIDAILAPELSRFSDSIWLDAKLYSRFTALDSAVKNGEVQLSAEQAWLLSEILRGFRRAGVELDAEGRERLGELNARIASLESEFSNKVVAGRVAAAVHIENESELAGLNEEQIAQAREAADRRGWDGWALELVNTTGQPLLDSLDVRATRKRLFEASVMRGREGENDTRPVLLELAKLRDEKAKLLGFEHYAAYVASDGCVKTTEKVMELLGQVAEPSIRAAEREASELRELFAELEPGEEFQAWDWQWTAAKAREASPVPTDEQLAPYLPFEQVLEQGVFAAAGALYGLEFVRREVEGYTEDCRAYEVARDGQVIGLVFFDPYARPTKGGGAWMTQLVMQDELDSELPIVTNNCNLTKPTAGKPALMTWDQVQTLFHEFGHDLHGLLSRVRYPSLSGTNTPTDFVEYPSQVNEIWAWEPTLIARYARHWESGEPLPDEWISALAASKQVGAGYAAAETYSAMLLDQAWHQGAELPDIDGIDAFEKAALQRFKVDYPLVPPRYRTCYFTHIWGHGYAAGYYSYLFSEVLDADTAAWFGENGGLKRENGQVFREKVLSRGNSRDVLESFGDLRGREADAKYLLERRALV